MRHLLVLVLLLVLTTFANAEDQFELSGKLMWTFTVTDMVSTELALAQGGFREGNPNPLMQKTALRIGYRIGTTIFIDKLTKHLNKKGKRKAASIIRWTTVVLYAVATGNNIVVYSF